MTATATKAGTAPVVIDLGADLSPALKAIEAAYRMIRKVYPDTPDATIVIKRDEKAWGHTTIAKVWAPSKREDEKASQFEIMISGENLRRGATHVVGTLLHEAAHARNLGNGILDTDTNGRHNRKFADKAEEHGLTVTEAGWHGFALTSLDEEGAKRWKRMVKVVETGLAKAAATADPDASHLGIDLTGAKVTPGGKVTPVSGGTAVVPPRRGNRNLTKAVCGCGYSIRASLGVLANSAPVCGSCGTAFVAV
jgi:hypothetical protein